MILYESSVSPSPYSTLYAIVPARSGSKGLPSKNMLRLAGLPLAEHSLAFALSLGIFDGIILSTDCSFLLSRNNLYSGVMYHTRSSILSSDTSSLADVILDIYDNGFVPDPGANPAFALLQPTSPFRSAEEFKNAVTYTRISSPDSLVFVSNVNHHPSEYITVNPDSWSHLVPPPVGASRRQEYLRPPFFLSGSLYISTLASLRQHLSFVNTTTSFWLSDEPYSVDIDNNFDFLLASSIYELMQSLGYALDVSTLPCDCFQ